MPFERELNMRQDLFEDDTLPDDDLPADDLPDDLAALAAQLSGDAERMAAKYPCGLMVASDREQTPSSPWSWRKWSWARAAAILAVAAGTALAVWRQFPTQVVDSATGPSAAKSTASRDLASSDLARVHNAVERDFAPTFVSADAAESLSGEEIEVLADAFADQVAEI